MREQQLIITDDVCYYSPQNVAKVLDNTEVVLVRDTPDQSLLEEPTACQSSNMNSAPIPAAASHVLSSDTIISWPPTPNTAERNNNNNNNNNTAQLEASAKEVLRKVLCNRQAEWTCEEQKKAVLEVLELKHDVLVILRTGAGKTMLPIIASQLEKDNVTVVVLPLKSLISDYCRRLKDMGIRYELFQGQQTKQLTGAHRLILVSADMAKQTHWKQCLTQLHECRPVTRLFFDEGHFAATGSNFRSALRDLYELRAFPMQLVVLSATIPPPLEDSIRDAFGMEPDTVVIRSHSDRPELEYKLEPRERSGQEVTERVDSIIAKHRPGLEKKDRVLVFVPYINEGIQIANRLGCSFYSGGRTTNDLERQQMFQRWIDGLDPVMVCTSAFGAGNDYPHVRLVIHAGSPLDMLGFR